MTINNLSIKDDDNDCKGRVFRCRVNSFWNGKKFQETISMNLLKRKSCPGCVKCGWLDEALDNWIDSAIGIPDDVEHGSLYTIDVTYESRDWESGLVDDIEVGFIKLEDE